MYLGTYVSTVLLYVITGQPFMDLFTHNHTVENECMYNIITLLYII